MNIEEIKRAKKIVELYDNYDKVSNFQGPYLRFDSVMYELLGEDFSLFQKEASESYEKIITRHMEFRKTKLNSMLEELLK